MLLGHSIIYPPLNYLLDKMKGTPVSSGEENAGSIRTESHTSSNSRNKESRLRSKAQWTATAKKFDVFPRPDENPKPSEWLLIWFCIRLIFSAFGSRLVKLWYKLPTFSQWLKIRNAAKSRAQVRLRLPSCSFDALARIARERH
jgi:hypothetical protein